MKIVLNFCRKGIGASPAAVAYSATALCFVRILDCEDIQTHGVRCCMPDHCLCLCHCHLVHANYYFTSLMLGFTAQFEPHFYCHFHPLNLSNPANFFSSRETGSLLVRAPLDCRAAAVCEKFQTHQVLRLIPWQCEDTYQTLHHELIEPVGDLLRPQYA